jgi:Ca2+-binding EF-hand superfamily protein
MLQKNRTGEHAMSRKEISMLVIKYERIDFWGNRIYTEDKKGKPTRSDLKKAFVFFGKNHNAAIGMENLILYWDSMTDYDNRIVSVRGYDHGSYSEEKKSFDKVKKEIYAMNPVPD